MKPSDKRLIKSATRLYVVQALFQMEASDTDADTVRDEFLSHRFGAEDEDVEWFDGNVNLFEKLLMGLSVGSTPLYFPFRFSSLKTLFLYSRVW